MITKDLKISKLLQEYPGSLDVLLGISPHFSKLQNKLLRNTIAGRVTVEQAASIAKVELNNLLSELNNTFTKHRSDNIHTESHKNMISDAMKERTTQKEAKPGYLQSLDPGKRIYLDVRPIIDSGIDPLKIILSEIKKLKRDEAFIIINSFEPVPLYTLLGEKGFLHWTEKIDDIFHVYFYKENESSAFSAGPLNNAKENPVTNMNESDFEKIVEIDVHDLQPPEPMMKILENLYRIDEKSVMLVYHHREPHLLYPILDERGYRAVCIKTAENSFKILITKKPQ